MYDFKDVKTWEGVAKTRKRCPHCKQMVEVGTRARFRSFRPVYYGWQRGGFLGTSTAKFPTTHAYHMECAAVASEMQVGAV